MSTIKIPSKPVNWMIKGILITLILFSIYHRVTIDRNWVQLSDALKISLTFRGLGIIGMVFLLMPINWGIEARKWHYLMANLPFPTALKAIFVGISLSAIIPNKLGDYGGRVLFVNTSERLKCIAATFVGGMAQLFILVVIGIAGLLFFVANYFTTFWVITTELVLFVALGSLIFLLICAYSSVILKQIKKWLSKLVWWKKLETQLESLNSFTISSLLFVLYLSFLRYLTFSCQYFLMLHFFGVDLPIEAAFSGIATIYLLRAGVPIPPILGVLLKGELAVLLWSGFEVNEFGILAATFTLFIINIITPSLLGLFYLSKLNILKSIGYERDSL